MKDFKDSLRASEESRVRYAIRRAEKRQKSDKRYRLSPTKAKILMKMVNLQFYHFPETIHPGNKILRTAACCGEVTARKMLRELEEDGLINVHAYRNGGHGMAVCYEVDLQAVIDKVDPPIVMADGELVLVHFARKSGCNNPTNNPTESVGFDAKTTQQKVSPVLIPALTNETATSYISSCPDVAEEPSKAEILFLEVTSLDQPGSDAEHAGGHHDGCDPDAWRASTADDAMPEGVIPLAEVSASVRRPRGKLVYLDAWRGAGELGSHRFAGAAA